MKMGLRELWSMRTFRIQVYLALEIAVIVVPMAYYAAEARNTSAERVASSPVKSNLFLEARQ